MQRDKMTMRKDISFGNSIHDITTGLDHDALQSKRKGEGEFMKSGNFNRCLLNHKLCYF